MTRSRNLLAVCTSLAVLLAATSALASSAGMPWEAPMNRILNSLTGPVAKVIGAAAIIGGGLALAFSDGGSGARKFLWIILGLAIAFSAVSFGLGFLGFSGGLAV